MQLSYQIDKKWNLIPPCFKIMFILEAASLVLLNNDFRFNVYIFLQLVGLQWAQNLLMLVLVLII